MVGLSAAQLGGSKLGGEASRRHSGPGGHSSSRHLTADALLENGPQGGLGSPQDKRHRRILESQARLETAAAVVEDNPEMLCTALGSKENYDVSWRSRSQARSRLSDVVLGRVRRGFLCAVAAHSKSDARAERLTTFHTDLEWARNCIEACGPEAQGEFRRFEVDAKALDAIARAEDLRQQALALAEASSASPPASGQGGQPVPHPVAAPRAAAVPAANAEATVGPRPGSAERRSWIVGEALGMLRTWKGHSEVAHALCVALLAMAKTGGQEFTEEMDRRGLGVLAATVADLWADRSGVARCALRLLGTVSPELLVGHVVEMMETDGAIVCLGLEVLNWATRADPAAVDEVVRQGGREMLEDVEASRWHEHREVALHALNLRRRLRKSKAKSLKPKKEVELPPEDVIRLRGCFESIDVDQSGFIDPEELAIAFQMLGMKASRAELAEALQEVDVDGSGRVEWPEFLWLMSRFGDANNIENQFSTERLTELREVFSLFDLDGNGMLDVKELGRVMRSVGLSPTPYEIQAMINEVDADQSGCIEWPEFLYLMSRKVVDAENQHRLAFEFFDKENEGVINRDSFIDTMQHLSSEFSVEDLDEMIFEAKFENGDLDTITYKEFVKMMMKP